MVGKIYGKTVEIDIRLEENGDAEPVREDEQVEQAKRIFRGEIVSGE
jgi:hypothetical protein